jgi:hypothetical protein
LEVGHGANNATLEKCTVTKPSEPIEKDHGEGQDPNRAVVPVKRRKLRV